MCRDIWTDFYRNNIIYFPLNTHLSTQHEPIGLDLLTWKMVKFDHFVKNVFLYYCNRKDVYVNTKECGLGFWIIWVSFYVHNLFTICSEVFVFMLHFQEQREAGFIITCIVYVLMWYWNTLQTKSVVLFHLALQQTQTKWFMKCVHNNIFNVSNIVLCIIYLIYWRSV